MGKCWCRICHDWADDEEATICDRCRTYECLDTGEHFECVLCKRWVCEYCMAYSFDWQPEGDMYHVCVDCDNVQQVVLDKERYWSTR